MKNTKLASVSAKFWNWNLPNKSLENYHYTVESWG
jgi:hypothetical protein